MIIILSCLNTPGLIWRLRFIPETSFPGPTYLGIFFLRLETCSRFYISTDFSDFYMDKQYFDIGFLTNSQLDL
jgi:hypothetical protein